MANTAQNTAGKIPIIDASEYFSGKKGSLESLAEQVKTAQEQIGFYYLVGHDVSSDLINKTFKSVSRFFALPKEVKETRKVNEHQIVYIPPKASLVKTSGIAHNTKLDTNEAYQLMRDRVPSDPKVANNERFYGMNQWPQSRLIEGFRKTMTEYHDTMSKLGWKMLPVYSVSLGMDKNYLFQFFREPHFINRNAHYAPSQADENQFGLAPHSDHGFITFLPLSDVPGLEVKTQEGKWIEVPHLPEAMLINTGEFLSRWTNGKFIATPHRVLIPKTDRYAITFFYNPSDDTINEPFETCISKSVSTAYKPTSFINYLKEYAEGNYLHQAEFAKRQISTNGSLDIKP